MHYPCFVCGSRRLPKVRRNAWDKVYSYTLKCGVFFSNLCIEEEVAGGSKSDCYFDGHISCGFLEHLVYLIFKSNHSLFQKVISLDKSVCWSVMARENTVPLFMFWLRPTDGDIFISVALL